MVGHLYVHVPFCASRCVYCDFFSTTRADRMDAYVDALCKEIAERAVGMQFGTIYIGGGTPSWLGVERLRRVFDAIERLCCIEANAEVTVECNPDDVDARFVRGLAALPVNRVSLGVQSLTDERLRLIGRRHDAEQAVAAVRRLQDAGYQNLSMDMMYGLPGQSIGEWRDDLARALSMATKHLSAYSLMYEEGTALWRMREQHRVTEVHEDLSVAMYDDLIEACRQSGLVQYELSNFARRGFESRHNMAYWQGDEYIGVGAGAHSFDGVDRRAYNVCDLDRYINGEAAVVESLTENERFNEGVFTALRTREGANWVRLSNDFPQQVAAIKKVVDRHLSMGNLVMVDGRLRLTRQALFVSDDVMSDLMIV